MSAHNRKIVCIVSLLLVLALTGCLGKAKPASTQAVQSNSAAYTQAAQTIVAELTQNATPATSLSMLATATAISGQALATEPPLPATSTPEPTETLPATSTPMPTDTPFPTEPPTPYYTDTPVPTPEPVFTLAYQDDFTSSQAWPVGKDSQESFHYSAGGYVIKSDVLNEIVWSTHGDVYNDVRLEVTAARTDGPMDGYYGLVCRFTNGGNYYVLAVGSDGWYGIGMKKSSQIKFLVEGKDTKNILTGNGKNKLRAECIGDQLTLTVNDVQLAQIKDNTFSSGNVGMAVGTHKLAGYNVMFDNFALYLPGQ